jgi:hypothetical protein
MRTFLHNFGRSMDMSVTSSNIADGGVEPQGVCWSLSLAPSHMMFVYIPTRFVHTKALVLVLVL